MIIKSLFMLVITILITMSPGIAEDTPNTLQIFTDDLFPEFNFVIHEYKENKLSFNIQLSKKEIQIKRKFIKQYSDDSFIQNIIKNEELLNYVKDELEKVDLPPEFAYIMIIESDLKVNTRSEGKYHGLWQLWFPNAKRFGMSKFNDMYCPEKSTQYAIAFLKHLEEKFDGDHRHMIYAYNVGETKIARLLKKHGGEIPRKYLPTVTQIYIPKIFAAKSVINNIEDKN